MFPIEWKEARPAVVSITDKNRCLRYATVLAVLTAGVESATGWERDRIGWTTGQGRERKVTRRVEPGDSLQERLGIRHPGVIEELSGRALLDDLSRIHHRDLIGVVSS
jgi:electron transfer flavoprotein alpha/beta subunit